MKTGKWERTKYVGVSLVDKTLAIMGFGKVRPLVCGGGWWRALPRHLAEGWQQESMGKCLKYYKLC
jgi:hypothetical protein